MGKPTKQDVRRGYITVIIVIFIVYAIFSAMSSNSIKAERTYVKVFYNLEDTWISEDKLTEVLTSEKQKSFVSAIYDMQQKAKNEKNKALLRLDWIDFNTNTLCEKFNYVFQPQDWLVQIKEVDIYDSGSAGVTFSMGSGNKSKFGYEFGRVNVRTTFTKGDPIIRKLADSYGRYVLLNGKFLKGDLNGDSECISKSTLSDFPEIEQNDALEFSKPNVRFLPIERYMVKQDLRDINDYELISTSTDASLL